MCSFKGCRRNLAETYVFVFAQACTNKRVGPQVLQTLVMVLPLKRDYIYRTNIDIDTDMLCFVEYCVTYNIYPVGLLF